MDDPIQQRKTLESEASWDGIYYRACDRITQNLSDLEAQKSDLDLDLWSCYVNVSDIFSSIYITTKQKAAICNIFEVFAQKDTFISTKCII